MSNYKSLQHTKWECKYHVVFIPKYRKKAIYGELRRHLGEILRRLAGQKESLNRRRAPAAGSCARDDFDTTQVLCGAGDRLYQGEECDTYRAELWREPS